MAVVAWLLAAGGAGGETIVVDTTADDLTENGNCTLREAIEAANTNAMVDLCPAGEASPTVDRIEIPAGTFDLTLQVGGSQEDANQEGDLDILEEVDLVGAGMDLTTIDGQFSERVIHLDVSNLSVLSTIDDLEIRSGSQDSDGGGGILSEGNLYLHRVRVTGNYNTASGGGGIYHGLTSSVLEAYDCEVSNNNGTNGAGGIWTRALVKLYRTTVSGNVSSTGAGGIHSSLTTVRLYNSTVSGNTAGINGGGILGRVGQIYNSTLVRNKAVTGTGANLYATNSGGNFTISNSILGEPLAGASCATAGGAVITSDGGNFESPGDTCSFDEASDSPDTTAQDLALTQLLDVGGYSPAHAPFPESVVVDTTASGCEADDQRGLSRDDGMCDAGAVELEPDEDFHDVFGGAGASFDDGTWDGWSVVVDGS